MQFERNVQDPRLFIDALRQYRAAQAPERGDLANVLCDLIVSKRVDLAEVRQLLLDEGGHELLDELDRLIDLIEPYLAEGGVDE